MKKTFAPIFFLFFAFISILGFSKGFSQHIDPKGDLNHSSFNVQSKLLSNNHFIDGKLYIDPSAICITLDGIFLNFDEGIISLPFIAFDDSGVYTYWPPSFDDDWRCINGHWSPNYENKCVTCGVGKQKNAPRWKDYK